MTKASGQDVQQMLKEIVGMNKIPMSVLGTVKSIDESEMSCIVTPIDEGPDFMDVLLMAENSTTGLYLKPTIGSLVMITPQNAETYYVSLFSSIDDVWIRGNANGGMPITSSIVDKLNNLENAYNDLVSKYNAHTHILTLTSGTGTAAPTTSLETTTLTPTQEDDIQSTTVSHG